MFPCCVCDRQQKTSIDYLHPPTPQYIYMAVKFNILSVNDLQYGGCTVLYHHMCTQGMQPLTLVKLVACSTSKTLDGRLV